MTTAYLRVLHMVVLGSFVIPFIITICSRILTGEPFGRAFILKMALAGAGALLSYTAVVRLQNWLEKPLANTSREQTMFLETISSSSLDAAIFVSAGLSLFLELVVIRWQSTVFEFFAFYKNLGLLSCFAGLGLGYALAHRRQIPLILTMPLLVWQIGLLLFLKYGLGQERLTSVRVIPFREQLNMGFGVASTIPHYVAVYAFLALVFLLTALAFVPIGQLCGCLMQRRPTLRAYGANLLGSLCGVLLVLALSFLWTPPIAWFAVSFAGMLIFLAFRRATLLLGSVAALLGMILLAWPVSFPWYTIYSPYQVLEHGPGERGLAQIRAAGHYYQGVHDLSAAHANRAHDEPLQQIANYYELPYTLFGRPRRVAIVGAGTGNDVAAALRAGVETVDAIEIDPAILALGQYYHPERPYQDQRVRRIVNDARSFFRTTDETYDRVVYGLLDSHTLLSHASSVRLDSFVYTVEGLREARARLNEEGMLSLSFTVLSSALGRKIYLMMQEAFDGRPPLCIWAKYDGSVVFMQGKNHNLTVPETLIDDLGFVDFSQVYADPTLKADLSTDDWPFFYMPQRVYPRSYVFMLVLVILLSLFLTGNFVRSRPAFSHVAFFFLGAGFMLVETKGITEMGLTFGNTWQVIGIVIAGVLIMAFLANGMVQWLHIENPRVTYMLLLGSMVSGLLIARMGGFPPTPWGRIATVTVLTCPLFFSGIVFSTLLRFSEDIANRATTSFPPAYTFADLMPAYP